MAKERQEASQFRSSGETTRAGADARAEVVEVLATAVLRLLLEGRAPVAERFSRKGKGVVVGDATH